ncbi:hypothetical protein ABBQ32_003868 [Trebouxia sp. C0010 RCD-2024]
MAPQTLSLRGGTAEHHKGVLLVAAYCNLQDRLTDAQEPGGLCLKTADGQELQSFNSICRYLASCSPKCKQLLGDTHIDRALVQDWLSFRNTELPGLLEAQMLKVDKRLQTKVFLAGLSVSLADLVMFATLYRALANIPSAQRRDRYPNLFRWFDFMQHTIDPAGHYKRIDIRKPRFQRAPPAPPSTPKPEKSKASDSKARASSATAQTVPARTGPTQASVKPKADSKTKGTTAAQTSDTSSTAAGAAPAVPTEPSGAAATPPKQDASSKKDKKKESKAAPAASKKAGDEPTVDMLDMRVGRIIKVEQHPNADSLYVEEIDLGEDKPRQVVSGLVKFVPAEQMLNRRVVVVTNLKPAKMRDVMSYGMVLCASNDAHDQVEPILPPQDVPVGEKITFEGYGAEPEAQLNPKKKIFEKISPDLRTNADGVAQYKSVPFMTSKGAVVSELTNAAVK